MPQDVEFALPWPLRVSPHLDAAREHNLEWMSARGLLAPEERERYLRWQLAEVSAYFYPEASEEGLFLATDLMGWYFSPFDDQFDGLLGGIPRAAAEVLGQFAALLHRADTGASTGPGTGADTGASTGPDIGANTGADTGPDIGANTGADTGPDIGANTGADTGTGTSAGPGRQGEPAVEAFTDLWRRWTAGMSPHWTARTTGNWCQYLAVYLTEAQIRAGQHSTGGVDEHLWRRRRSISAYVLNDLYERVSGFEVPPLAWHSQALTALRDTAADIVSISNDVASVEKEEADGTGGNNLLLILERDHGMNRDQSLAEAVARTRELATRFRGLEPHAHALARCLPPDQETAVLRYIVLLQDFMAGNDRWERTSHRYTVSGHQPLPL
ncbi:terpene synthase family protein [Streptomyces clavuligerus]|uniref:terpene synthase family protein n=1 Tax=Streptomyces clavuligerus TaxID=1901 RepID=UPI00017FFBFD|nr:hypothetical protein [Streptomyces clavuligerus]EDY49638.1 pentalenene synthase [Streptomyces clavuligerus]MBY6307447.1 pentalenene synthase [Streptomyces clavuligerus]QCS10914.1 pentalenene synthase [Streptomyces clavuligerus]QPJ97965.1 pentalenene synthase [Streptomyces clavuligerus]WDN56698.1 pentalenene synthase [Streptomyces clavuligerus]